MVHYPQKRAPLAGVAVTVAWIVLSAYYSSIRVDALLCVILAWCGVLYACYLGNTVPKYPLFVGSGRTKVATQGYELLIKGKGQGDDYFTSQRELSFADLDNFQYARGSKVSLKNLLKHYPFTVEPYCLDDENQCVIFVETPMAFDCAMVGHFTSIPNARSLVVSSPFPMLSTTRFAPSYKRQISPSSFCCTTPLDADPLLSARHSTPWPIFKVSPNPTCSRP